MYLPEDDSLVLPNLLSSESLELQAKFDKRNDTSTWARIQVNLPWDDGADVGGDMEDTGASFFSRLQYAMKTITALSKAVFEWEIGTREKKNGIFARGFLRIHLWTIDVFVDELFLCDDKAVPAGVQTYKLATQLALVLGEIIKQEMPGFGKPVLGQISCTKCWNDCFKFDMLAKMKGYTSIVICPWCKTRVCVEELLSECLADCGLDLGFFFSAERGEKKLVKVLRYFSTTKTGFGNRVFSLKHKQ